MLQGPVRDCEQLHVHRLHAVPHGECWLYNYAKPEQPLVNISLWLHISLAFNNLLLSPLPPSLPPSLPFSPPQGCVDVLLYRMDIAIDCVLGVCVAAALLNLATALLACRGVFLIRRYQNYSVI